MELTPRNIETISGLFAGFTTTVATHPLDLIKVRLQLAEKRSNRPFELLKSVISDISAAARRNPGLYPANVLRQMYRGVLPNLIGNVSAWSIYFTLYDEYKRRLTAENGTNYFAALTLAGLSTGVLTNPIWVIKTRILSTSSEAAHSYRGLLDGFRKILTSEGISTFWRGSIPGLVSVFQGSLQFTLYDHLKNYLSLTQDEISLVQYVAASLVSRVSAMVVLYPPQTIKSRLQNFSGDRPTIRTVLRQLRSQPAGLWALYQGLGANIVRVLPSTAVMFLLYESCKKFLAQKN